MELLVFGSFVVFGCVALVLHFLGKKFGEQQQKISNNTFIRFQQSFYMVYFLALLGDWLQGPYVYKLYSYYGYQEDVIAVLYVAGFASSVLLGTFTGPLADILGRKKIALAYCIIYIFCCITKLSKDFWTLFIGRLCGGVATSMLFSAFESWYVSEHTENHGFPSEWISGTFSMATFCNGLIAIFAGVVANFSAEALAFGPCAPFMIAILPLAICFVAIYFTWPENYGSRQQNMMGSCGQGLYQILEDKNILMLGILQTVCESSMYIFVFLWTPVMAPGQPPYGMVFACFMVAVMIGSSIYSICLSQGQTSVQTLQMCMVLMTLSLGVCTMLCGPENTLFEINVLFFAFIIFEISLGIYFPSMSTLKSALIPESHRANVMNWFRVPTNIITCVTLLCLKIEIISNNKSYVFGVCFLMSAVGIFIVNTFSKASLSSSAISNKTEHKEEIAV